MSDYPQKPFPNQSPNQGTDPYYIASAVPASNSLGVAGFVTSIIGILTCGILSIIGVIMSAIAMTKPPRGFALAGLIIGFVGLMQLAFVIAFFVGAVTVTKQAVTQVAAHVQLRDAAQRIGQSWEAEGKIPTQTQGERILRNKKDIWNQSIVYETDGESFSVRSIGPDGIANSADDQIEGPFDSAKEARSAMVEIETSEFDKIEFGNDETENKDVKPKKDEPEWD